MRIRRPWNSLLLSALLLGAGEASAGTLSVDFDLGDSFLPLNPSFIIANGFGPSVNARGSARAILENVDAFGIATGAAQPSARISNLMLTFGVNIVSPPMTTITGLIRISQDPDPGPPVDRGLSFDADELMIRIKGAIHCTGFCTFFEPSNPLVLPVAFDAPLTSDGFGSVRFNRSFGFGAPPEVLSAMLRATQGPPVNVTILGREVARRFVPEPEESHVMLVGIGMLAAAGAFRIASASRRRTSA